MTQKINTYKAFLELKDAGEFDNDNLAIGAMAARAAVGGIIAVSLTSSAAYAGVKTGETDSHSIYVAEQGDTAWDLLGQEGVPAAERRGLYDQIAVDNGKNDISRIYVGDSVLLPRRQQPQTSAEVVQEVPPASRFVEHTVEEGQNLTGIARQYGISVDQVLLYNDQITNPDFIKIGQNIRIIQQSVQSASAEVETSTITVKPGQTLSEIEQQTGDKVSDIAARNGISNPDKIYAGQQIVVQGIAQEISDPEVSEADQQQTAEVVIQPGQNLTVIAEGHATTVSELVRLNEIIDQDKIYAGNTLDVPVAESEPAPASEEIVPPAAAPTSEAAPTQAVVAQSLSASEILPDSTHINRQWNIPMGEDTQYPDQAAVDEFKQKVEAISAELQIDPDHLMAVISFETAGTFRTDIPNGAGSGATGLIQFMPRTAESMGTSTEALANMTPVEQLDYVRQYFIASAGQLGSLEDVYLKVFYPEAIGRGADFVLPGRVYRQNNVFDKNKDGEITVGEISATVRDRHESAPLSEAETTPDAETNPEETGEPEAEVPEAALLAEAPAEVDPAAEESIVETEVSDGIDAEQQVAATPPEHLNHPLIDWPNVVQTTDGDRNPIEVVRVAGGDHVDVDIALNLARMIEAASAEGMNLTVYSGHRSIEEQEVLRTRHGCGTVFIYDRSCKGSPVTAVPGSSNHNDGEAVDLRRDNAPMTRDSKEFIWLSQNAAEFGFYNLPSEPWHWSVNGR